MADGNPIAGLTNAQRQPVKEIDILWITAGLGCDGDTIAMTAATQPNLEEVLLGGIPGIPKVRLHNPFLSYENGEEFISTSSSNSSCSRS
jgi:hydrogenase small subunit